MPPPGPVDTVVVSRNHGPRGGVPLRNNGAGRDESGDEVQGEAIGGWTGFTSLVIALYRVGGVRLLVTSLVRFAWAVLRRRA